MTKNCPNCKSELGDHHSFCPNCGHDLRKIAELKNEFQPIKVPKDSLFLKTGLKLLVISSVLIALTIIYSLFEGNPSKIITFFITTFIISILSAIPILFIGRIINKQTPSLINNPYKVILTLILVISLSKIFGVIYPQRMTSKKDESIEQVSNEKFTNAEHGVSFDYDVSWVTQTPQSQSTLILLYETFGTQATCNLSVIAQDKNEIEDYNTEYFKNALTKIFKSVDNVQTTFKTINDKKVSWTTYDYILHADNNDILAKSVTVTTLNKGQRFMLVINVPRENFESIEEDIRVMTESLIFN